MRVALIPPVPDLDKWATTNIHLLLSHLFRYPEYLWYYKHRGKQGDYLILDNSAHEFGVGNRPQDLLDQAKEVQADEVVCPDVLFDFRGTVERTRKMLHYIASPDGWEKYGEANYPKLMLVPQGTTRGEWVRCLGELLKSFNELLGPLAGRPPVIGVSKDYEPLMYGGLAKVIEQELTPLYENHSIDTHCLGWPSDLWALARVQDRCPWVRSTDSAKPFVYAKAGIRLEPGGRVPQYPKRADDYFLTQVPVEFDTITRANVEVFKATATNELILA